MGKSELDEMVEEKKRETRESEAAACNLDVEDICVPSHDWERVSVDYDCMHRRVYRMDGKRDGQEGTRRERGPL